MTAIPRQRTLAVPILLLAIVVLAVQVANLVANSHALERHGDQAQAAIESIGMPGNHPERHHCRDGRDRIVSYDSQAHTWAVVVLEGDVLITSFTTISQDYIVRMLRDCDNRMEAHP